MRIRIAHETRYVYEQRARSIIQVLRLTPRSHDGQHVVSWMIDPSVPGHIRTREDSLGNIVQVFEADQAVTELRIAVLGEVETADMAGIVRHAVERVPDPVFLRETSLTTPDPDLRAFARRFKGGRDTLACLHDMLAAIHDEIVFDTARTQSSTSAAEAFALRRGVCQDLTHIFLATARQLEIPCRYVSGYFRRADGVAQQDAGHAWAEAKVPGLGWVGFDPANGISVTDAHVRVAVGLDYLGAAPIRGSQRGGGGETMGVKVTVDTVRRQAQS